MPRGGLRNPPGGRPTLWDEYTAKAKLQKYAPKAFATFGQKAEVDPFFAEKLVKKFVADRHQVEAQIDGQITINLDPRGFVPEVGGVTTAPAGSNLGPPPVQDPSLAPPGQEDDHSANGTS